MKRKAEAKREGEEKKIHNRKSKEKKIVTEMGFEPMLLSKLQSQIFSGKIFS